MIDQLCPFIGSNQEGEREFFLTFCGRVANVSLSISGMGGGPLDVLEMILQRMDPSRIVIFSILSFYTPVSTMSKHHSARRAN